MTKKATFLGLYLAALPAPDDPAWPTPSSSRNVYVLLTEFVEGTVLGDMRTEELSKDERRQIMDEVFELESHLFTLGVRHDDYRPQNLILLPQTVGSIGLTLLVLDFEQCSFYAETEVKKWDSSPVSRTARLAKRWSSDLSHRHSRWILGGWLDQQNGTLIWCDA